MQPPPNIVPPLIFKRIEDLVIHDKEEEARCIAGEWGVQLNIRRFGQQIAIELRKDIQIDSDTTNPTGRENSPYGVGIDDFIRRMTEGNFWNRPWPSENPPYPVRPAKTVFVLPPQTLLSKML